MASESSFDMVNKVDRQEVDNAVNQAAKEISQRFDFKNIDAGIKWSGEAIDMQANTEERVKAVLDVFQYKLISGRASRRWRPASRALRASSTRSPPRSTPGSPRRTPRSSPS